MAKKTAPKVDPPVEPKFRKLGKGAKVKVGKYYEIGKHVVKAEKVMRIETNKEITEHDVADSLPKDLKEKLNKKK